MGIERVLFIEKHSVWRLYIRWHATQQGMELRGRKALEEGRQKNKKEIKSKGCRFPNLISRASVLSDEGR